MENELAKLCIWREARGEIADGIAAVCWVIKNRMIKHGLKSFEVVTSPNQFSSMIIHSDPQTTLYPRIEDHTFELIDLLFDKILSSDPAYPDLTDGATFYRNEDFSTSVWFDVAVRDGKLIKTSQIGRHTFYKEA